MQVIRIKKDLTLREQIFINRIKKIFNYHELKNCQRYK